MRVLVLGNGGREHALAWKVAQSAQVKQVWVAPGNAGTASETKIQNIDIAVTDVEALIHFAKAQKIDLTIVGPEAALAVGVADQFNAADLAIFAPTKAAAQLEISKNFCKEFMIEHNIPTATYQSFSDVDAALNYLEMHPLPVVIKADGLAAGKGVIITEDREEAKQTVTDMLNGERFGKAGNCVVIESFVEGTELSYIVMVDGEHVLPLASSKDHKRRDNGDKGPNTGGMGAVSPSPLLTPQLEKRILNEVIMPTVEGMKANGTPYVGFLYAGIMVDHNNQPFVLEFNCRLGDPETQALLPRLNSDLAELCLLGTQQKLNTTHAEWTPQAAVTVVMASGGYPQKYHVGTAIQGLNRDFDKSINIFQAGTKRNPQGVLVTNGGRVLCVTALDETLQLAYNKAYNAVEMITWTNCYYRTDIGLLCMTQPTSL